MSFLSTLFGGQKGLSNSTQSLLNSLPQQQALGTANTTQGLSTLQGGVDSINAAGNYFNTILNGSQTNTEKQLAPQVNTVLGQYDSALKAGEELGPRGGGRTAAIEGAKTGKVGAYGNLLAGTQASAASGLAATGQAKVAAGGAAANVGLGETGQALGQATGLANATNTQNSSVFANAASLGGAIGNAAGGYGGY